MNQSPRPLTERTLIFSRNVLTYCAQEKPTNINKSLIHQLVRSATSIGANYAEANNAASKADFKSKIFIAKKEAAETKYWLSLFSDMTSQKEECQRLLQECHYILMTLQKIVNTLNHGKRLKENA